jgi:hypothetical protein
MQQMTQNSNESTLRIGNTAAVRTMLTAFPLLLNARRVTIRHAKLFLKDLFAGHKQLHGLGRDDGSAATADMLRGLGRDGSSRGGAGQYSGKKKNEIVHIKFVEVSNKLHPSRGSRYDQWCIRTS